MWKRNFFHNHGRKITVKDTWNQAFSGLTHDEVYRGSVALRKSRVTSPPRFRTQSHAGVREIESDRQRIGSTPLPYILQYI